MNTMTMRGRIGATLIGLASCASAPVPVQADMVAPSGELAAGRTAARAAPADECGAGGVAGRTGGAFVAPMAGCAASAPGRRPELADGAEDRRFRAAAPNAATTITGAGHGSR